MRSLLGSEPMKEYYQLLEDIARQAATVRQLQKRVTNAQSKGQPSRALDDTRKSEEHKLDLLLARRAEAQTTEEVKRQLYQQQPLMHVIREEASE